MTKVLSNKLEVSAYTQATLLTLAGAVITLVFSPLLGGLSLDFSGVSLMAIILVVLGQGLGNIVYFAAVKSLTNGTAQIAFSSILIFNTFLSLVFLNLHLSLVNGLGIIVLLVAILCVVTGKIEHNKRGIILMVCAAFLFSIFQLSSAKLSKQVSAATYLMVAYLGSAVIVFAVKGKLIVQDLSTVKGPSTLVIPFLTAAPSAGNFLFAYYAYRSAPSPAKVAMLLTSQVVLTVFLSYFFLKEKGHIGRKIFAAILVVIAAIMIKS